MCCILVLQEAQLWVVEENRLLSHVREITCWAYSIDPLVSGPKYMAHERIRRGNREMAEKKLIPIPKFPNSFLVSFFLLKK